MTNIKFFKFVKKDVMIDDIEGFFEVHKQGTNGALVIIIINIITTISKAP